MTDQTKLFLLIVWTMDLEGGRDPKHPIMSSTSNENESKQSDAASISSKGETQPVPESIESMRTLAATFHSTQTVKNESTERIPPTSSLVTGNCDPQPVLNLSAPSFLHFKGASAVHSDPMNEEECTVKSEDLNRQDSTSRDALLTENSAEPVAPDNQLTLDDIDGELQERIDDVPEVKHSIETVEEEDRSNSQDPSNSEDFVKIEITENAYCRFCAQSTNSSINIFDQHGAHLNLFEKISKFFPIILSIDDQLPKTLCLPCLEKLEFCFSFNEQIHEAHKSLIQQLQICQIDDPNFDIVLASYFEDSQFFNQRYDFMKSEEPEENDDDDDEDYDYLDEEELEYSSRKKRRLTKKRDGRRSGSSKADKTKLKHRFTPSLTTCSKCGHSSASTKENFEHWAAEHKDLIVEYRCYDGVCEFKTNCIMTMKNHTKEHMFKEGKLMQCEICAKYFHKRQIKNHIAIHSNNYQYSCNKCGKMFKVRSALVTHEKTHDPEYTQNTFTCPDCGKEYSMKHQFDAHVRRHTEVRPYRCEVCSKAFWSPNDLQYHMSIHTGLRPYPCSQCDLKFARPLDVKKHFMTRHTEPNRFCCPICPVKYNRKDQLKVHELSHTGETPFKCEICGKGFTRKDKLIRHSDVHITDDSKYRFSCHLCEKRYTQSGSLFTHMKNSHGV